MAQLRWLGALLMCCVISSLAQETSPSASATGQSAAPARTPPVSLIPRSHEERENRYEDAHRVLLNVLVTDASGRPATELRREDFTLLDNGKPQNLASFRAGTGNAGFAPARVILMLDTVNNNSRNIANDGKELERFLAHSPERLTYPTSIAVLSGSGARVGQSSQERDALLAELRMFTRNAHAYSCPGESDSDADFSDTPHGASSLSDLVTGSQKIQHWTCLNSRFQVSVSALNRFSSEQMEVPGRVILIWIGPGWPLLSGHEFRPDSVTIRQNFFDNLVEVSNGLREAQITLDNVSVPNQLRGAERRSDHDNAFMNGVPTEDQVTAGSLGLQVLAHQSGGQVLTEGGDLAGEIAKCIADAESYYVLSFDSPSATAAGEFHSLQVKVNKPGLTVRTNTAYYAQP